MGAVRNIPDDLGKAPSVTTEEINVNATNGSNGPQETVIASEEQPLLGNPSQQKNPGFSAFEIVSILSVILLGEFLAAVDGTIILAAGPAISSAFNKLEDVNWLTTAYTLGVAVVQPTMGKLSDIFGRKPVVLVSYFLFALGRLVCGIGNSMLQVIIGRTISGMGGAGMMIMASIIITDLVPKREVALWRSYVNLIMTLGRSMGGPIGGLLVDTVGWRWLFLSQVPLVAVAIVLVSWKMHLTGNQKKETVAPQSIRTQLRRIDFLGSLFIAVSMVAGMLLLDMGGQKFDWLSKYTVILAVTSAVTGGLFLLTEAYVANEPIFPLRLMRQKDLVLSYLIMTLQAVAQVGMMFSVPLYFQITAKASNANAGMHLVPAVAGNACGGLLAGLMIRSTGRYKLLATISGLIASISYVLMIARWGSGHISFWEALEIIPGGFGTGLIGSVIFVSMTAALDPADIAMAMSGLFQCMNIGVVGGVTSSSAILKLTLRARLTELITGPEAPKIIEKAMSDSSYVSSLTGPLRRIVVSCYVAGLQRSYFLSLACSLLACVASLLLPNRQL